LPIANQKRSSAQDDYPFTINPDAASVKEKKAISHYFQEAAELRTKMVQMAGFASRPFRQP
jgi:hypothetical protein